MNLLTILLSTASGMESISAWTLIPFGLMLLMIAIGPIVAEHWWEKNVNKLIVSLLLGIPTAIYLAISFRHEGIHAVEHQLIYDYVPFIILLCALFVTTGGIHLSGDIKAKPIINTCFLGIGWVLASIMGTTGAAMLLIRPLLTTNSQRKFTVHTVLFFIAIVANCGGLLTPLGDPPLFLLYLRGASFTWFLTMLPQWAFTGVLLLILYFIIDSYFYKKEDVASLISDSTKVEPIHITGNINFLYLVLIVVSVAFINPAYIEEMGENDAPIWIKLLREIILISIILLSIYTTRKNVRDANKFSWGPIIEVAVVFLGIFTTMIPAMTYLKENASSLGLSETWQFYYYTGALSSFLDNAPTAVAFHSLAGGLSPEILANFGSNVVAGVPEILLKAISIGAVFFGAMTYIGNGPNFMVKSIAEESGIKMPSFFGYMIKFSLIVLLPIYIIVQILFL
jgi:Na+/H+ antiporter NhaD/arsenite permease-like protein